MNGLRFFHWHSSIVLIPSVFIGGYGGGGAFQRPSGVNMCNLSDANDFRYSAAGITRNILIKEVYNL